MKGAKSHDLKLDDFLDFLFDLRTVLRATDRTIALSDTPTTDYTVSDLSHSSPATIELRAETKEPGVDFRDRVLKTFIGGVKNILSGEMPRGFSTTLLIEYQDLARHLNGRLREALFVHGELRASVSSSFRGKIEEIVGPDQREHGEVSGFIEIINAHQRRPFFLLYPLGSRDRIKCFFNPQMMSAVGQAIKRHVTASGMLHFRANMLQPHEVSVRSLDVHERDADLPGLGDLRGIAPDATGDVQSEEFIRRLRDAW